MGLCGTHTWNSNPTGNVLCKEGARISSTSLAFLSSGSGLPNEFVRLLGRFFGSIRYILVSVVEDECLRCTAEFDGLTGERFVFVQFFTKYVVLDGEYEITDAEGDEEDCSTVFEHG